jgi:hypothetical protein
MTHPEQNATTDGVTQAWNQWLYNHDITVPGLVEVAVAAAFTRWLNANTDALITGIAEAVAKRTEGGAG